jgi:hypothetical protein
MASKLLRRPIVSPTALLDTSLLVTLSFGTEPSDPMPRCAVGERVAQSCQMTKTEIVGGLLLQKRDRLQPI